MNAANAKAPGFIELTGNSYSILLALKDKVAYVFLAMLPFYIFALLKNRKFFEFLDEFERLSMKDPGALKVYAERGQDLALEFRTQPHFDSLALGIIYILVIVVLYISIIYFVKSLISKDSMSFLEGVKKSLGKVLPFFLITIILVIIFFLSFVILSIFATLLASLLNPLSFGSLVIVLMVPFFILMPMFLISSSIFAICSLVIKEENVIKSLKAGFRLAFANMLFLMKNIFLLSLIMIVFGSLVILLSLILKSFLWLFILTNVLNLLWVFFSTIFFVLIFTYLDSQRVLK